MNSDDEEDEEEVRFLLRLRPTPSPPVSRRRKSSVGSSRPVSGSGWGVVIERQGGTPQPQRRTSWGSRPPSGTSWDTTSQPSVAPSAPHPVEVHSSWVSPTPQSAWSPPQSKCIVRGCVRHHKVLGVLSVAHSFRMSTGRSRSLQLPNLDSITVTWAYQPASRRLYHFKKITGMISKHETCSSILCQLTLPAFNFQIIFLSILNHRNPHMTISAIRMYQKTCLYDRT
ncbi:hypothetical protein L798_07864 [Zootermopsis nevadensis]|uniref:Uncharacterized protein n=1 Tax=Zootermopsis nevadensis TaxID=136037 RepID=A0A067RC93_ZOONE|nr:hypothetical protein L798_07864 [Zootermopsis nevadensis]